MVVSKKGCLSRRCSTRCREGSGIWNQKSSLNISVPHAGKYILRIGKQNHSITMK